jgi:glycosyltransferase involved in cell wall biosynthesis
VPEVSIIIPNYNHAAFLGKRMDSILNQSFRDFEIILLDDCSSDNSREIIESYRVNEKITCIILNDKNSGSTFYQWKRGMDHAKGNFIWIAESDDYCDANFLETAVSHLRTGNDLFFSRTINVGLTGENTDSQDLWLKDVAKERWYSDFQNDAHDEIRNLLFIKNTVNNASAVVFRKKVQLNNYLEKIQTMKYVGDWLFWILYLEDSEKIYYSVATTNYFRTHSTVTRAAIPIKRNKELLILLRHIFSSELSKGNRAAIADYFFRKHLYIKNKRGLSVNLPLFFQLFFISPHFLKCWIKYYTGKLVR